MTTTYYTQSFDSIPYAIFFINTDVRIAADKSNLIGDKIYFDGASHQFYVIWSVTA